MRNCLVLVSVAAFMFLIGCASDTKRTEPDPNAQAPTPPLTVVGDWDVVGIEALIIWLANHNPGMMRAQPAIGTQFGIDLMQTILKL